MSGMADGALVAIGLTAGAALVFAAATLLRSGCIHLFWSHADRIEAEIDHYETQIDATQHRRLALLRSLSEDKT